MNNFSDSNIRLVTLSLAINLLKILVYNDQEKTSYLSDSHLASIEQAHEQATEDLRRHYRVRRSFDCFFIIHREILFFSLSNKKCFSICSKMNIVRCN